MNTEHAIAPLPENLPPHLLSDSYAFERLSHLNGLCQLHTLFTQSIIESFTIESAQDYDDVNYFTCYRATDIQINTDRITTPELAVQALNDINDVFITDIQNTPFGDKTEQLAYSLTDFSGYDIGDNTQLIDDILGHINDDYEITDEIESMLSEFIYLNIADSYGTLSLTQVNAAITSIIAHDLPKCIKALDNVQHTLQVASPQATGTDNV